MANGRIFYNNIIRNAALTVGDSDEEPGFEVTHLRDEIIGTKYRSRDISEISIVMDLGAATAIEGIAVLNHNIEAGDVTYKFESSDDNFLNDAAAESGDLILKTRTVKQKNGNGVLESVTRRDAYYAAQWNRRYYRLKIEKSSGSYIEIGEIYLLTGSYELEKNYNWGYSSGYEKNFSAVSNEKGVIFKKRKYSRRVFSLQFQGLDDSQKELFDREIGENEFVVFLPEGVAGDMFYGAMEFNVPKHSYSNYWEMSASFTELL